MSFAVDANILLYASNSASPHHRAAARFLEEAAAGREIVYIPWPVAMAYLRIATHPRIFAAPLRHAEALANLESLTSRPNVRLLTEGPDFLALYREVTDEIPVGGNLVPDAHLAALLLQNGVRTLYTNDVDFRRFDFLDPRNPLT